MRRLGEHAYTDSTRASGPSQEEKRWARILHTKIHAGLPPEEAVESYGSHGVSQETKSRMLADHKKPLDHTHFGWEE